MTPTSHQNWGELLKAPLKSYFGHSKETLSPWTPSLSHHLKPFWPLPPPPPPPPAATQLSLAAPSLSPPLAATPLPPPPCRLLHHSPQPSLSTSSRHTPASSTLPPPSRPIPIFMFLQPALHFYKDGKKAAEVIGADVQRLKDAMENLYK
ncbi:hypothetical protein CsSME_00029791 [Camellia sinensis var. sinensis]